MSTRAEHYDEAERLLRKVSQRTDGVLSDLALPGLSVAVQMAQVHATLALAPVDVADPNYHSKRSAMGPS